MRFIFPLLFIGALSEKSERNWKDTLKLFIPFLLLFLTINYKYLQLTNINPMRSAGCHAIRSLNIGHQDAFCGKIAHTTSAIQKTTNLDIPMNKLVFQDEAQKAAYCSQSNFVVTNETSLSYVYAYIFKVFPSITFNELANLLNFLTLLPIIFFAFILFRLGLSSIYVLFISTICYFLNYNLGKTGHIFAYYSFFISNYLFFLSICILYLYGLKKNFYKFLPFGIFIGLYAAFYCNFRTSHALIVLYVLFVLLIFIYLLLREFSFSKVKTILLTALSFLTLYVGFQLYTYTFLKPIYEVAKTNPSPYPTYHGIAHPLVLSLGITSSDLSQREGIKWRDSTGISLARQIDTSVVYGSKQYEKALFVYYCKLWLYYSQEMLEIYKNKFQNLKTLDISSYMEKEKLRKTILNAKILEAVVWMQSKVIEYWNVWFVLLSTFGLLGIFHRKFSLVGLFFSFSVVGSCFLLLCESAIIMHTFILTYHSLVNVLFFIIFLYYIQIIINFLYRTSLNNYQRFNEIKHAG